MFVEFALSFTLCARDCIPQNAEQWVRLCNSKHQLLPLANVITLQCSPMSQSPQMLQQNRQLMKYATCKAV